MLLLVVALAVGANANAKPCDTLANEGLACALAVRRLQTAELGISLTYDTAEFEAQAQVARDMAAMLSNFQEDISPAALAQVLEHNLLMHPEIYGTCIAFEPDSYPWQLGSAAPAHPGLRGGVASASGITADGESYWGNGSEAEPWTLAPHELWAGKSAMLYAPYAYRGGGWVEGGPFFSMDLADGYNYWDLTTEWYHGPRTLFLQGELNFTQGYWTEPYFDAGVGNVNMVTFSVPFWRHTPMPETSPPVSMDAPWGAPAQHAVLDRNGEVHYFWGIATIDVVLEALVFQCPEGEVFDLDLKSCVVCAPGSSRVVVEGKAPYCQVCPSGSFSPGGTNACLPCLAGTYTDQEGAAACYPCAVGLYAPFLGSTQCSPCEVGSYASAEGLAKCSPCGIGTYMDHEGATVCSVCGEGVSPLWTTMRKMVLGGRVRKARHDGACGRDPRRHSFRGSVNTLYSGAGQPGAIRAGALIVRRCG